MITGLMIRKEKRRKFYFLLIVDNKFGKQKQAHPYYKYINELRTQETLRQLD